MGERFTINAEILIQLLERGGTEATQAAIRDINIQMTNTINVNQAAARQTSQYSYSLRRVALDLRMMSIGLRILRQEYGGISPVVDVMISSLYQVSAVGAVLVGGFGLAANSMTAFRKVAGDAKTNMEALRTVMYATAGGVYIVAAALGVLLAIGAAQWTYGFFSGIAALNKEIKRLEEGLRDVKSEMRNLGVEEGYLTAQSAALSAQIRGLEREIDLQGYATDEQTARLKSLQSTLDDVGVSMGYASARTATFRADVIETTDSIEDLKEMEEEANKAALRGLFGGGPRVGPQGGLSGAFTPPGTQIGGLVRKRGIIGVEAGEVIMQREQVAMMMMAAGRGADAAISVTISLAGAHISGVQDLEDTLRRGGEAASEEIRRLNLLRRRGRSRF